MFFEVKPCALCGKKPYMEGDDTLHPDGGWQRIEDDLIVYTTGWDIHCMKEDRPEGLGIDFGHCYTFHCPEVYGGCGMQVSGNSKEEAIQKWNRRPEDKDDML